MTDRELLDAQAGATRTEVEGNLADIATANRWLGGTSVVLRHLSRMICTSSMRQPVRILDIATGGADIPIAIARWADRTGITVQITAVDRNPMVVEIAQRNARGYPEICVDRQDILSLPYQDRSFDYVILSQIIHDLDNEQAAAALRSANRLSSQGIIVSDLRRNSLLAYLVPYFVSNRLSRHDAGVSFQNAFTPNEIRELAEKAELPRCAIHLHGPCRLSLISDKRTAICDPERKPTAAFHAIAVV